MSAALAIATEIGHGEDWDAITAALIPHLPDEERRAVLAQPMSIRVVQAATPYLSSAALERLLAEADPDVLVALARHAGPALSSRILDAVGQMHPGFHQELVLDELAPRLQPQTSTARWPSPTRTSTQGLWR
ncbi:hypothetical protein [Lentzea guizhouensis]|uniref:hypothetical protein n=1 Tax=Lentzea guizhouensis TaxID=1586287 RepID=UPI0012B6A66A|nr:hypothetical protein [Lentzea guizhouensis]